MKKLSLVLLFAFMLSLVGCPQFTLQDETQLENLKTLKENYALQAQLMRDGDIPSDHLIDSYEVLIDSAIELEESKEESWQEQARREGWEEPDTDEEEEVVDDTVEEPVEVDDEGEE